MSDNMDKFLDEFIEEDLDIKSYKKDEISPKQDEEGLPQFTDEPVDSSGSTVETIKDDILSSLRNKEVKLPTNVELSNNKESSLPSHKSNKSSKVISDEDFNSVYEDESFSEDELADEIMAIIDWEPEPPRSTPEIIENEWITTGWIGFLHVDKILTDAILTRSSDVHLTTDQKVAMSRNGDIVKCDGYHIPDSDTMHLLIHDGILSNQEQAEFNKDFEYDGSYTLRYGPYAGSRTRINIGRSFGDYFIVFRIINDYIPSLAELEVEQEIVDWSYYPNGLFLLCGPTGTGKSTTLASVVYNLLETSRKKVVTIEKPIEYIYPDDTPSLVVQREVGGDTRGFYEGLTSAMRQNPDVILIGEVRNTEEITELLRAAETGHLAISTMHTNSVSTTINRIQNLFSGNEQRRVMSTLADTLRGIANQVLVKDMDGGRFAVREILTITDEVRELIISGDVSGIRDYQYKREGTIEHKLALAVKSGRCLASEAKKHVTDIDLFNSLIAN